MTDWEDRSSAPSLGSRCSNDPAPLPDQSGAADRQDPAHPPPRRSAAASWRAACAAADVAPNAQEFHRWSLRFPNRHKEAHFVRIHSDTLLQNLFFLAVLTCLTCLGLCWHIWNFKTLNPEAGVVRRVSLATCGAIATFASGVAVAARAPGLLRRGSPRVREASAVFIVFVMITSVACVDLFYLARLLGYEPGGIFPGQHFTDTRILLSFAGMVTAAHLCLPIRWILLLPVNIVPALIYASCYVPGGTEDQPWSNLLLLMSIIIMVSKGRRTIEIHQRESLTQLIAERSLRVQTEFQLSQLEQRTTKAEAKDEERVSARESRPETTNSDRAFGECIEDDNLQRVADIGCHEQWLIHPREVALLPGQVLGEGSFGRVFACEFNGTPAALKALKTGLPEKQREDAMIALCNELRIMRRLRHPNIVLFYGALMDLRTGYLALVMERVRGMSLEDFISGKQGRQEPSMLDRSLAIADTCRALRYLHSRRPPVVHGDLKGSNILVELSPLRPGAHRAKLLDFGLARVLTRHERPLGGTLTWMAPEIVERGKPSAAADVFSFGRLAFFVLTGLTPFPGWPRDQILRVLRSGSLASLPWKAGFDPRVEPYRDLLDRCGEVDPKLRPSMEEVGEGLEGITINEEPHPGIKVPLANGGGRQREGWRALLLPRARARARAPLTEALRPAVTAHSSSSAPPPSAAPPRRSGPPAAAPAASAAGGRSEGSSSWGPLVRALPETPRENLQAMLIDMVRNFNFRGPKASSHAACCSLHAGLAALSRVVAEVSSRAACADAYEDVVAQCQKCGGFIHRNSNDWCAFCSMKAMPGPSRRSPLRASL